MEIALTCNELKFKNKALTTATNAIIKARNSAVSSYLTIGEQLMKIRDSKLYKDDFSNFEDFTVEIFGLSKSTAYRMIAVTSRFLIPEKGANAEKFFTDFEDTALGALLSVPIPEENANSTYSITKDFCEEHCIDTTTSVSDIRKIIKEVKEKDPNNLNVETIKKNNGVDTEETESGETGDGTRPLGLTDVQRDNVINMANVVLSFVNAVRTNAEKSSTITENGFKVLTEMFKVIQ